MLWNMLNDPLALVCRLIAVVVALSFHEWGHAFAAYRLGDSTARDMGRMSIDPFRHLDPLGFLSMMLVGFGWAKPVPVNPNRLKHGRWGELIVSIAGVTVNFLLAFVATIAYTALSLYGSLSAANVIYEFLISFLSINLGLMVFNLVPIPPLDGYRVAKSLLIGKVKNLNLFWTLERYGSIVLMVLVVFNVLTPVLNWGVNGVLSFMLRVSGSIFGLF